MAKDTKEMQEREREIKLMSHLTDLYNLGQ